MISIAILCALIIYLFGGYLDSANDQGNCFNALGKGQQQRTN
jgi:hypothetical protein